MLLPFKIQGEGAVLDSIQFPDLYHHQSQFELLQPWMTHKQFVEHQSSRSFVPFLVSEPEPTSVLDNRRCLSPTSTSSTLSSSLSSSGTGLVTTAHDKCSSLGMDEFDNVLSDFGPEQSMFGYCFDDHDQVDEDHSLVNLNKFMHGSAATDFSESMGSGFSGYIGESGSVFSLCDDGSFGFGFGQVPSENSSLFLPAGFGQQDNRNRVLLQPDLKRLNTGILTEHGHLQFPKLPFSVHDPGIYNKYEAQRNDPPTRSAIGNAKGRDGGGDEAGFHQLAVVEDIFKAVELIQVGNLVLAQRILARLNHQLSPIAKPFQRVAFYFKESLQLLLEMNGNCSNVTTSTALSNFPPAFGYILKIDAYKSFSETSPVVHFANFTCNQAILESVEGFDNIHVIDFDIGYAAQWASFMQELALRNGISPSLRITAFVCPSTHDDLEFSLVQENLNQFAAEVNLKFQLRRRSLDEFSSMPLHVSNGEVFIVNLPVDAFSNYPHSLPLVLRSVKLMSPKIMVSSDRSCDQNDLPFPHHTVRSIQFYTALVESMDASIVNPDVLQKIERFFIHPSIERMLVSRRRRRRRHLCPDKISPWRNILLSSGFSPYQFSNITESQADYLVKRIPGSGFHVEKRQSSIVLCWQQKELISVSAWRC